MEIPKLEFKDYKEYNHYSIEVRSLVVYNFLFKSYATRKLDREALLIDSSKTNGWRSFEILGYMGLKNAHKGLFKDHTISDAVEMLKQAEEDCSLVIEHLECYETSQSQTPIEKEILDKSFEEQLDESQRTAQPERLKRINLTDAVPTKIKIISSVYRRNSDITAEVLFRANGICERCELPAPFKRAKDGSPYLEIHHKTPLSESGEDSLGNTIALCPNCHRELHYGAE